MEVLELSHIIIDNKNIIRLLLIYTKTEKENISDREIKEVLKNNNLQVELIKSTKYRFL